MPLFPIHDLAREDDIRMRRRRALLLLAGLAAVPWMLFGGHADHAARPRGWHGIDIDMGPSALAGLSTRGRLTRPAADAPTRSLQAASLAVDLSCAASVTLLPEAGLGDRVIVSAGRGQDRALQALVLADGVVRQPDGCAGDTGDFTLQMAADKTLSIRQQGDLDIHGGRFTGPVAIDSSGTGSVTLRGTGALTTRQQASGDVLVGTVSGDVTAVLQGSGDLRVEDGRVPHLSASLQGSGDVAMGRAAIGEGRLSLEQSGDFTAGNLTGHLEARTSGSGDITIGSVTADSATLEGEGSGDILVRGGRIGVLTATRRGSGDLVVRAVVGDAAVSHQGDGDVTLPNVMGRREEQGQGSALDPLKAEP